MAFGLNPSSIKINKYEHKILKLGELLHVYKAELLCLGYRREMMTQGMR
jgi:hypothetical protein